MAAPGRRSAAPGFRKGPPAPIKGACPTLLHASLPPGCPRRSPAVPRKPWLEHWLDTLPGPLGPDRHPSDDGCGHRRDRWPDDPNRRPLARGLRVVQLPRLRPRRGDHRVRGAGARALGHPSELVAAPRQPRAVRADRGPAHGAAGVRGLAGPAHDHAHPHVRDPAPGGLRHDLPRRARPQDDLRRLPGSQVARRGRAPLPLRGSRSPRRAHAGRARPHAAGLHGRREQHDRQPAGPARVRRGRAAPRRAPVRR